MQTSVSGSQSRASILDDRIALVASVSDASDDLPRGQAQAICRYTGLLASDREVAATRGLDTRREREPVQQRTGDDQVEARPLGVLLESRGGIEDVTDEDDLLSEVAKLAGGHGAAVESAAKTGHESEIALIPSGVTLDRRADLEKGSDADRARRMRMRLSNAGPPQ